MRITEGLPFVKGHGTQNDFVVLVDPDGALELTPALVRAICDRRAGIGADGVLRAIRTASLPAGDVASSADAEWFMDYRNGDGSVAQMCGNGVRVLARYLVSAGLVEPGTLRLATRCGVRVVDVPEVGDITVDMGQPRCVDAAITIGGRPGTVVSMGNPHVVVDLADLSELAGLDLSVPPPVDPVLAEGQNVEFVVRTGSRSLALRVYERGAGETRSCGTGACAAVVATIGASAAGEPASDFAGEIAGSGRDQPWTVAVPGGTLTVTWTAAGPVQLAGPAVLVASGEWLAEQSSCASAAVVSPSPG